MEKIKFWLKLFKLNTSTILDLDKKKSYPRDYSKEDLGKEIDKCGNESPNSHLGSSYYARASLGLTELERRNSSVLGWSTFWVSVIALVLSLMAVRYTAEQTQYAELQSRSERIIQLQNIQRAIDRCKISPKLQESGLFDISNGQSVSCLTVLKTYKN